MPECQPIRNAISIDVEEYFQVGAFEKRIRPSDWHSWPSRVEQNVDRVLSVLDEAGVRGTFFTLGWVAENRPRVVRRIIDNGHELACHGWAHGRLSGMDRKQVEEDVSKAKRMLEDVGGQPVVGYRAPSFSVNATNTWVFRLLEDLGFRYSSSVYPVRHDHYGFPEFPRFVHRPEGCSELIEIPVTTAKAFGRNWPCGGGGYFRLLPLGYTQTALRSVNREGKSAVFYLHPWELDADQPRVDGIPLKSRFRHYVNLSRMPAKLARLLGAFSWGRVDEVFLG
jgi:polysaccharide deacetylase family protein (PEP-CTERM system associated)